MKEWTRKEEGWLIENGPRLRLPEAAGILGRSEESVRTRARRLGVRFKLLRPQVTWTEEDEQYLIDHYASDGAVTLAEDMGRKVNSVRCRATKLGLRYTKVSETEQARGMHKKGWCDKHIAASLGREYSWFRRRRRTLRANGRSNCPGCKGVTRRGQPQ